MKINIRLAFTISGISVVNILILTALMHLKFHVTNMNLIKDSIAVATFTFVKSIQDATEMGIPLESMSSSEEAIKSIKIKNKIIKDIQVFSVVNNSLVDRFVNDKKPFSEDMKKELIKTVNSNKTPTWRYDDKGGLSYVGNTVRDNVGNDRAVVIVTYNRQFILDEEAEEISNLYKRMGCAALMCLLFSYIIGAYYTNPIERLISNIKSVLKNILNGQPCSLEKVTDYNIKSSLEHAVNNVKDIDTQLKELENRIQVVPNDK